MDDEAPRSQAGASAAEIADAGPGRKGRAYRVVLTGGPCGGKSSALGLLRSRLQKQGFQVLTVPECATPLFEGSGGYDMSWAGTRKHVELQQTFLRFQIAQENAFLKLSTLRDAPAVILYDRGVLDGFTFCSDAEWEQVLQGTGQTITSLYERYDAAVHLVTAAAYEDGRFYQFGEGSNNPARFHNAEQALESDKKSETVYRAHPNYFKVENKPTFTEKINDALSFVTSKLTLSMGLCNERSRCTVALVQLSTERAAAAAQIAELGGSIEAASLHIYEDTVIVEQQAGGERRQLRKKRELEGAAGAPANSGSGGGGSARRRESAESTASGAALHGSVGLCTFEMKPMLKQDSAIRGVRKALITSEYQTLSENAWCGGRVVSFLRKTAWTFWYGGFYYELIRWEKDTRLAQEEQGDAAASSASAGGAGGAGGAAGAGGEREKRRLSSEVVESEENARWEMIWPGEIECDLDDSPSRPAPLPTWLTAVIGASAGEEDGGGGGAQLTRQTTDSAAAADVIARGRGGRDSFAAAEASPGRGGGRGGGGGGAASAEKRLRTDD